MRRCFFFEFFFRPSFSTKKRYSTSTKKSQKKLLTFQKKPTPSTAEYYACALTSVYTFGPTFRAENSHTSRHLAEFWMIEPEIAFADLRDDMRCAEDFIVFCVRKALACCSAELDFLENHTGGAEKGKVFAPVSAAGTRKRLEAIAAPDSPGFARVSYTEAVEILKKHIDEKKVKFELPVEWGVDLASEHERYLTDVVHEGRPVIVFDYPKEIKAFYMRVRRFFKLFFSFFSFFVFVFSRKKTTGKKLTFFLPPPPL